jgi:hypothetical protein
MKSTTLIKFLTILGSLAGAIAASGHLSGVDQHTGAAIIGASAFAFKVCDMIENALANSELSKTTKPNS